MKERLAHTFTLLLVQLRAPRDRLRPLLPRAPPLRRAHLLAWLVLPASLRRCLLGDGSLNLGLGGAVAVCCAVVGLAQQNCIALSTCEAEIIALSEGAKDVVYTRKLLRGLGDAETGPTPLSTDSQSARDVSYNPEHHDRMKHVQRRHILCARHGGIVRARGALRPNSR